MDFINPVLSLSLSSSYCVIVFNLPQRSSSVDDTNYCMDFAALRIPQHKNFKFIRCREKQQRYERQIIKQLYSLITHSPSLSPCLSVSFSLSANADKLETETIVDLTPGESYLIYVTANLSMGKPLPYQTLTVHMGSNCPDLESQELPEYY